MDLKEMASLLADSSLAIAGAIVAALLIWNAKSIILAIRDTVTEFNKGRRQEAESLVEMQKEFIRAGQDSFKDAVDIVTKMAENSVRRMEEMERDLRDLRLEGDRKDVRIAEQEAEIVKLKGEVKDLQRQLDAASKGVNDAKPRSRRAGRSSGRAAADK